MGHRRFPQILRIPAAGMWTLHTSRSSRRRCRISVKVEATAVINKTVLSFQWITNCTDRIGNSLTRYMPDLQLSVEHEKRQGRTCVCVCFLQHSLRRLKAFYLVVLLLMWRNKSVPSETLHFRGVCYWGAKWIWRRYQKNNFIWRFTTSF